MINGKWDLYSVHKVLYFLTMLTNCWLLMSSVRKELINSQDKHFTHFLDHWKENVASKFTMIWPHYLVSDSHDKYLNTA